MSKKTDLWMPLYVGDYLADTGHLTTTQHGAYLLLLMHYWRKRELPDDDKQLAAIAKLPLRIWLDSKETIQAFFHMGWQHKRLDAEIEKRMKVANARAIAGQKGGARTQMNSFIAKSRTEAIAPNLLGVCSSMTQSPRKPTPTVSEDTGVGSPGERAGPSRLSLSTEAVAAMGRKQ
jgi:uncharacterized protein YdaU (DUF1376 family)